jgi:LacI family transcriptional regulator
VSRVLNHEANVRPDTRERVKAAVAGLGYRPNLSARSLAGSRSFLIGLCFDNPNPAYVSDAQIGAIGRCRESGYHLLVEPFDALGADPASVLEPMIFNVRVDGVILTPPVSDHPAVLAMLDASKTPYVRVSPERDRTHGPSVYMDDYRAAYDMTVYLLGLGHKRIGFVRGHPEHGVSPRRYDGFAAAMADHGCAVDPDLVRQGYFTFQSGFTAAESLLSHSQRPTAIFAASDDMALGVMSVAARLGVSIPSDLSVVGFDDNPAAKVVWPQLTTVRQPIAEMAAAAAELLISGEAKTALEAGQPLSRMLDFEIILRQSCGPMKASPSGQ